ncbi:MAG: DUF421 domain-containing protein [Ruminococcaceae bacterium]|nr:DUF421 domain-containing protein [Oscillospiraceae bacterium]
MHNKSRGELAGMITVFARTILIYLILIISMRLMGKRQVGELQLSELIVTIMLSDFAATPIYETDIPFAYAVIPILLLLSVEVILSFIILHVPKLKILLGGRPSLIIRKGTLDQKELKRQRMCLSELIGSLREQGIASIDDVEYAILEENGKLSVFEKASKKPPSAEDTNTAVKEKGIAHSLILDKVIVDRNLTAAGWTKEKLMKKLREIKKTKDDILLFSVDDSGNTTIIYKEEK